MATLLWAWQIYSHVQKMCTCSSTWDRKSELCLIPARLGRFQYTAIKDIKDNCQILRMNICYNFTCFLLHPLPHGGDKRLIPCRMPTNTIDSPATTKKQCGVPWKSPPQNARLSVQHCQERQQLVISVGDKGKQKALHQLSKLEIQVLYIWPAVLIFIFLQCCNFSVETMYSFEEAEFCQCFPRLQLHSGMEDCRVPRVYPVYGPV